MGSRVVDAAGQRGGYGPSLAARCGLADGRRVFIKAVSPAQNADSPAMMRREGRIAAYLPPDAPAPELLHTVDDGEWIALVFEEVDGRLPSTPWVAEELDQVLDATLRLGELTPVVPQRSVAEHYGAMFTGFRTLASEGPAAVDDEWCREHLDDLAGEEARWEQVTVGDGLIHGDVRSDNVLLTPDGAWDVTYRGARPLDDQTYARYKETTLRNVLYILRQRLSEPGLAFYSQGTDLFEFHPVEIVDITDSRDITVTVYFDQRSKLPVHQTSRRRNEQFKDFDTEVTNYGLYRDVGHGVKWPFNIRRERNGEKIFEMFSDDVQINKDLTDDLFTLAGNIKILPKAK